MAEPGVAEVPDGVTSVSTPPVQWSWLQFVVPALLLWGLTSRHGPALYLFGGIYLLAGSISLLGLLIQAMTGRLCRQRSLGRALNIVLATLAFTTIHYSLESARRFIDRTAEQVADECRAKSRCPEAMPGWEPRHDRYVSQHMHEAWLRWPVLYHVTPDGLQFELRLYYALDSGETRRGGVP